MKIEATELGNLSFGFALLDESFSICTANEHMAALFQKPPERIIARPITDFIPQFSEALTEGDHFFHHFTLQSGQTLSMDVIRITDQGFPAYLVFCQDHTKYDQILEQVAISNKKKIISDRMLDLLYDGCFISDGQGITLYVNDSFLNMSGLTREEILGKSVYGMIKDKQIPKSCTARVIETGKPASMIIDYFSGKSCLITGAPVFIDGKLERVICTSRDMTELQAMKSKLANATSLTISLMHQLREIEVKQTNKYVAVTRSKAMNSIYEKAVKVAPLDTPILIQGETGVGKDFLVRFIHGMSGQSDESCFTKVNCGAIPETLLESELFGYEPGAFTDASKHGKIGFFEMANNGTLFLDEIGEMSLKLQVKLLDVIQYKQFYRLGGTRIIKTNARIIAATNANLEKLIADGKFRSDIYYRLNVINLTVPPLRNRKEDILPLGMFFLEEFNAKYQKSCYFKPKALEFFLAYNWPGNIREMKNMIERLVIMADANAIEFNAIQEQIPADFYHPGIHKKAGTDGFSADKIYHQGKASLKEILQETEKVIIAKELDKSKTLKEAAENLGIDISTLVRKKQKFRM